ncbi:molybdate ABC transporter substrate-binding protein [Brassicibacter mesophilus]|uniref:molybdate ABC transporter substrate-binding protein n=1 Tax=Brassicibacter mesophilus TaxID=745119 RepID=UPI003D1E096A
MKKTKKVICCFMIIALLFSLAACNTDTPKSDNTALKESPSTDTSEIKTLLVYCGAGLKKPMTEIAGIFEKEYNVKIDYTFAGSAQLLSQAELSKKGDIFIVGSMDSYNVALEKELVFKGKPVAYHIPVIGVPKGNPANIKTLEDMTKPGIKVILGDEKANAIGKAAQRIIKSSKLEGINTNVVAKTATVNELGVHLSMKDVDASIVTLDLAVNNDDVEYIEIPEDINSIETIPVGTLKNSQDTELSNKFVDFVSSEEGKTIFEKHGFPPVKK